MSLLSLRETTSINHCKTGGMNEKNKMEIRKESKDTSKQALLGMIYREKFSNVIKISSKINSKLNYAEMSTLQLK